MMKRVLFCLLGVPALLITGCGEEKNKVTIPTTQLTAQQVMEVRNEDARVTDEESYGTSKYVPPEAEAEAESKPSQFGEGD